MSADDSGRWSTDGGVYVDAFRADVDAPVDVDAAWARFEVEAAVPAAQGRPTLWLAGAVALAAALALAWWAMPASVVPGDPAEAGLQAPDRAVDGDAEQVRRPAPRRDPPSTSSRAVHVTPGAPVDAGDPQGTPRASQGVRADPHRPGPNAPPRSEPPSEPRSEPPSEPRSEQDTGPSRLARELRLIEAMRVALDRKRFSDALAAVRLHAQDFEKGPFAAERELARVRALCGLRRLEDVRAAKAHFVAAFPRNHLTSVVQTTCAEKKDHDG